MEQKFQQTSSVDYSLKEGETLVLQLKSVSASAFSCQLSFTFMLLTGGSALIDFYLFVQQKSSEGVKSRLSEHGLSNSPTGKKSNQKESLISIKPPPPPPGPLSPTTNVLQSSSSPPNLTLDGAPKLPESGADDSKETNVTANQSTQDIPDDDFGDFQAAV